MTLSIKNRRYERARIDTISIVQKLNFLLLLEFYIALSEEFISIFLKKNFIGFNTIKIRV